MFKFFILLWATFSVNFAVSGWSHDDGLPIDLLKVTTSGVEVIFSSISNTDMEEGCTRRIFYLDESASNYQARYSMLLSAYISKEPVRVSYYSCANNGSAIISSVVSEAGATY